MMDEEKDPIEVTVEDEKIVINGEKRHLEHLFKNVLPYMFGESSHSHVISSAGFFHFFAIVFYSIGKFFGLKIKDDYRERNYTFLNHSHMG